jgi:hypothetical protein
MKCCNEELTLKTGKKNGVDMVYYVCPACGKKGKGKTQKEAEKDFLSSQPDTLQNTALTPMPSTPDAVAEWSKKNLSALIRHSAQFIDRPSTQRMIEKNVRYISGLSGGTWTKIWSSPEGRESIEYALSEALYHAATLPDMGSIVPFGSIAEFIPSVECYKFALETGNNAPFKDIQIIPIHENDITKCYRKDGNLCIDHAIGIPRGEIIAVAVTAIRTDTGNTIGEIYDVSRLMEKAAAHSPSYKNFIIEKENFQRLKSEGKLQKDAAGREYMEIEIPKRDGTTWKKKTYETDLVNPYEGPDRPEMLRKSAGKSFFRPYMKVRNSAAMAEEWQGQEPDTRESVADDLLNRAGSQFANIIDAEFDPVPDVPEKKEEVKNEKVTADINIDKL